MSTLSAVIANGIVIRVRIENAVTKVIIGRHVREHLIFHVVTADNVADKLFLLVTAPRDPEKVMADLLGGGGPLKPGVDFEIVGKEFRWAGRNLDGILEEDDELRLYYLS